MRRLKRQPGPPWLGAAYYPEAWPPELVDEDIRLMREAGLNAVRVAEFAWSSMEPHEGEYDFAWLHRAVEKLAAGGISVIMCTPTATPPAWLSEKHPEILAVNDWGVPAQHGARRHNCPNNPVYRDYCAGIVTRLAKEFGAAKNIIGWQIDNELYPLGSPGLGQEGYLRGCCCPVCRHGFQAAMEARFGTIEALNRAWNNELWSQSYQSFAQLPVPRRDVRHSHSLIIAWMEFQSASLVDFAHRQADILHRRGCRPVGTDLGGAGSTDYRSMLEKLDIVQFNHYTSAADLWKTVFWFDFIRNFKARPFWNTETSTCWNGGDFANGYKEPGFCRVNSWLPVALGGEANLYWLWRAHRNSHELMHGSVVSSCGRPMHIFEEVKDVARGFGQAAEFLTGTAVSRSKLAVHFSGLAWRFFKFQPIVRDFKYWPAMADAFFRPLFAGGYRPEVIETDAGLEPYRLLLSPFLPCLDEPGLPERLLAWVEAGGTWVTGPLTDIRDPQGGKYAHAPFGRLEEWAGVRCRYQVPEGERPFRLRWADGRVSRGAAWHDGLEPAGAETLARYEDGHLAGLAAVTARRVGRGKIILLGTVPENDDLLGLLSDLNAETGVAPAAETTENLLAAPRHGPAGRGLAVLELFNRPGRLTLAEPMTDLLSNRELAGRVDIKPYEVLILKVNR